jgi:hypothetical protein
MPERTGLPVFKVNAEARGKLRQVKQELDLHYRQIERLFPRMTALAEEFVGRNSIKGRQRVFAKPEQLLAPHTRLSDVQLEKPAPLALWAALKPREAVQLNGEEPGEQQACICLNYLLVGAVLGPNSFGRTDGLWTLEVSDHALHQLTTRAPGVAVVETLHAAHQAALLLPLSRFTQEPKLDPVWLRASPGVFICELVSGYDVSLNGMAVHLRAKTWLHGDQIRANQQPLSDGLPGDRMGEAYLRPPPLRKLTEAGTVKAVAWVPDWASALGQSAGTRQ